jgi:hypothetical protein
MATLLDDRQVVNRAALSALGNTANNPLSVIMPLINAYFANATNLPTASVLVLRDANGNADFNSVILSLTSTVTSGVTTTLTVASTETQIFTGTSAQTVQLPAANTLTLGQQFFISNQSTGSVQVNDGSGASIQLMAASTHLLVTVTNIGSIAGTWDADYTGAPGGNVQVYPTVFAGSDSTLSSAITTCASGGVICVYQPFNVTSAHTIPTGCLVIGRLNGSLLTFTGSGAITMSDDSVMRDVWMTTALTTGTLITMSHNRSTLQGCRITVPSTSATVCVNVTGQSNLLETCTFVGVEAPSTGVGIEYSALNNSDLNCIFMT